MAGFRGHVSTKSRCYSTILTALRQARQHWRNQRLVVGFGYSEGTRVPRSDSCDRAEDETLLVIGNWQYIGRGHSPEEAIYARTIADDLAENRRALRQAPWTERKDW